MADIRVGIIPAAGTGSRLGPLNRPEWIPKALLPLSDGYVIDFAIGTLFQLGVREIHVIIGPEANFRDLTRHVGDGSQWGMKVRYEVQHERKGLGHAISLASELVGSPFAVVLGDDLTLSSDSLRRGAEVFERSQADALEYCVWESEPGRIAQSCSVAFGSSFRIRKIVEKPTNPGAGYRGIGVYLFRHRIYEAIHEISKANDKGPIGLTPAISALASEGDALAYPITGTNININTPADYDAAIEAVSHTSILAELRRATMENR